MKGREPGRRGAGKPAPGGQAGVYTTTVRSLRTPALRRLNENAGGTAVSHPGRSVSGEIVQEKSGDVVISGSPAGAKVFGKVTGRSKKQPGV